MEMDTRTSIDTDMQGVGVRTIPPGQEYVPIRNDVTYLNYIINDGIKLCSYYLFEAFQRGSSPYSRVGRAIKINYDICNTN